MNLWLAGFVGWAVGFTVGCVLARLVFGVWPWRPMPGDDFRS